MATGETELEMVERHGREGAAHVANQREIVAYLRRHGHRTDQAEKLLRLLEELQQMHLAHLDRIRSKQF